MRQQYSKKHLVIASSNWGTLFKDIYWEEPKSSWGLNAICLKEMNTSSFAILPRLSFESMKDTWKDRKSSWAEITTNRRPLMSWITWEKSATTLSFSLLTMSLQSRNLMDIDFTNKALQISLNSFSSMIQKKGPQGNLRIWKLLKVKLQADFGRCLASSKFLLTFWRSGKLKTLQQKYWFSARLRKCSMS